MGDRTWGAIPGREIMWGWEETGPWDFMAMPGFWGCFPLPAGVEGGGGATSSSFLSPPPQKKNPEGEPQDGFQMG